MSSKKSAKTATDRLSEFKLGTGDENKGDRALVTF